jgi:hypothetical protein
MMIMRITQFVLPILGVIFIATAATAGDDPDHSAAAKEVNQTGKQTLNEIGTTEENVMKNNDTGPPPVSPEQVHDSAIDGIKKTGDFVDGLR